MNDRLSTEAIRAKMLACGEIDLAEGMGRETITNGLLLECEDSNWRVRGGTYYVVREEEYVALPALEKSADEWKRCALKAADELRNVRKEQEAQIAVMREAFLDIALRGDSLPVDATPEEHDAAIIEMRDMANDALTPDTRYRAVDVAWLKEIEWMGAVQMISGRYFPMTCPACHQMSANGHAPDCWLAELIGEGE